MSSAVFRSHPRGRRTDCGAGEQGPRFSHVSGEGKQRKPFCFFLCCARSSKSFGSTCRLRQQLSGDGHRDQGRASRRPIRPIFGAVEGGGPRLLPSRNITSGYWSWSTINSEQRCKCYPLGLHAALLPLRGGLLPSQQPEGRLFSSSCMARPCSSLFTCTDDEEADRWVQRRSLS